MEPDAGGLTGIRHLNSILRKTYAGPLSRVNLKSPFPGVGREGVTKRPKVGEPVRLVRKRRKSVKFRK